MNYQIEVRFLVLAFVCQSLLCMKMDNSFGSEYKGIFGRLYIKNMETQPTKPTIKIKELKQGADLNQNLQVPVFNNQNNNQPVNQNQNLQMPVFNGNQEVNAITVKPKKKGWFSNLSNNWKAFFIDVGTGFGAALVDAVVAGTTTNPYVFGGYMGTSIFAYPALRYQLYLRSLKEDGKSYGKWIAQEEVNKNNYEKSEKDEEQAHSAFNVYSQNASIQKNYTDAMVSRNDAFTNYDKSRYKIPDRLFSHSMISLFTSNAAWIITHFLLSYATRKMLEKKSEDNI